MRGYSPERAIQSTRELGRVTHEGAPVSETGVDQASLDRLNPPVHHITRCNAVCASACVAEGDLGDTCDGEGGVDRTVGIDISTVTV